MPLRKSHLYSSLWQSCDQLRGGMDASQYKDYVLTLLFMKYVSDKYAGSDDFADITVPPGGGFADMVALKGTKEIGDGINKVIGRLADANDYLLKGVIDQADFNDESKLGQGKEMQDRLTKLVGIFEGLDFRANRAHGDDLLGDAYEYLMRHFATQSGKSKGQFYTPAEVSRIMAQVIGIGSDTRRDHTVYDPTCGSGSLLIKAADEAPHGLTVYGQEKDVATWTMARMNMILHGRVAAEIERDNTLAAPRFTEGPGRLKRFDFAVANPPFSDKAWTNGLDPANDEYRRFEYGEPPARNGDLAFLLHLVTSLNSTGKGAIVMPHGVLFRGNREADIRRRLIRQGLIKGIIGLPANLFYGTGIPACIVVIDKENAVGRSGIFMIDASKGFQKDGAKNRLRERDIHRIVDVFTEQREIPGYSRMVPSTEIASEANDYNLNIPRYIDSSEPEDLHDLAAHLHGGIPNRDINALGAYWEVFPGLRKLLFSPNGREGYGDARVEADEVRGVVLEHGEFKAYGDRVRRVVDGWRREHAPSLRELAVGDSPKALIRDLSEDLLDRFAGLPLLDSYGVYQCLMDYWDEIMQDDVYLVVTEGWMEAARPRVLVPVKGKATAEIPDLTVNRKKYRMDLLPPGLLVARHFATEQAEVDRLRTEQEGIARELEEFIEEYFGEDGLLEGATSDTGKVTQAAVRARLKAVVGDAEGWEERDALEVCLDLMKALAAAKRAAKAAQTRLDSKVLARYATLTAAEITELVVGDKWMASVKGAIGQVVERLTGGLVDRVRVLEGRYARPLPELERRVEDYGAKVEGHLERMGVSG
ncbi:MAG: SAM-dependent DNA methyltransferase [Gemmatimonadetes bacterium]|nr:SAM-dependent DNA methyltransferase [Gemmatimonadota bacterium]MYE95173.1 SAM-dependent DNA methyltransferase [Gemmatimonadota bacterium]